MSGMVPRAPHIVKSAVRYDAGRLDARRGDSVQDVIIYGTHGFASEVQQLIDDLAASGDAVRCVGFLIDPGYRTSDTVRGLPVFREPDAPPSPCILIGIGDTRARQRIARDVATHLGARFRTFTHPRACVGRRVDAGAGSVICAGAIATADIVLGAHVQLHVGCTIGHDTTIGDVVTIAPGANVSGRVTIGEGSFVGAGAVILPDIEIGAWATIGAGAVVTRNVPAGATVVGVPAHIVEPKVRDARSHG
jgi:sugar O-acyltransferase (sialic acid O-acetyltransferase NeuD family)